MLEEEFVVDLCGFYLCNFVAKDFKEVLVFLNHHLTLEKEFVVVLCRFYLCNFVAKISRRFWFFKPSPNACKIICSGFVQILYLKFCCKIYQGGSGFLNHHLMLENEFVVVFCRFDICNFSAKYLKEVMVIQTTICILNKNLWSGINFLLNIF